MSADTSSPAAAVPGLIRSDPHGPGITRERVAGEFRYHDPSGLEVTSREILRRIGARQSPGSGENSGPWEDGQIQVAAGVPRRGQPQDQA